jgi:hypothetical protein
MKDDSKKLFLDQCYEEFKLSQEYYDYFIIATDFYEVVTMFKQSGEVIPTILCRTPKERDIVLNDEVLSSLDILMIDDVSSKSIYKYKQFYFYKINDAKEFVDQKINYKTYYFSSTGLNLTKEKDSLIENDYTDDISKYLNHINIFDLYKQQTIGRALY